ncbi:MAG: hypothetical protein MZV65_53290 [Chromatiales bacterium]|nr:hypothetical protein [Chromatiales bacterium]
MRTKPDGFILDFFAGNAGLAREYAGEIGRGDLRALRAAFPALYPVLGLEDAFPEGPVQARARPGRLPDGRRRVRGPDVQGQGGPGAGRGRPRFLEGPR